MIPIEIEIEIKVGTNNMDQNLNCEVINICINVQIFNIQMEKLKFNRQNHFLNCYRI